MGGSVKVALSAVGGTDWLTFEGLFLPEDSLNLDLDFRSATRHRSLELFGVVLQAAQIINRGHFTLDNWHED